MTRIEVEWDGTFENYARKVIRSNLWRVRRVMDKEDFVQEAALLFYYMLDRYGDTVDSPQHFMGLYKTALDRQIHDLSKKSTKVRENEVAEHALIVTSNTEGDDAIDGPPLDRLAAIVGYWYSPSAHMNLMVQQAPREVRQVLNLILNLPNEMAEALDAAWRSHSTSTFGNKHLCALLGYDPTEIDLVAMVHSYFLSR